MKRLLFSLLLTALFPHLPLKSQQVINGSFDNWNTYDTFEMPDSWVTMDSLMTVFRNKNFVSRSPDAYSAPYAASIHSRLLVSTYMAGVMSTYIPCQGRPTSLSFYYKFTQTALEDTVFANIVLQKKTSSGLITVGLGKFSTYSSVSGYTRCEVPITYYTADIPDSAGILFQCGNGFTTQTGGSELLVDDVKLEYTPTAIHHVSPKAEFTIYPNPAASTLRIDGIEGSCTVTLYDMPGQEILTMQLTGNANSMDISHLPAGTYLVKVSNGKLPAVKLISKQ
jgi:hypothetical protein